MGRKLAHISSFRPINGGRARRALDGEGEAAGFVFDLLPGAAGDAPAGQFELLLTFPVGDEGAVGVVESAAVGFDDQPASRQRKSAW